MPPKLTIPNFLIRSRALWLSVFLITFLTWAWYDSMVYCTTFSYCMENFSCFIESRKGGLTLSINDPNPFIARGFSMLRDLIKYADPYSISDVRTLIFEIDPPHIQYSTLMLLVIVTTTAWLTWRWRKTVAALSNCHANS